jgi:branched-chain amino acid transport system ATP-binding protein
VLSIEKLQVSYGPVQALQGVSLEVPQGKIISIIGSNGAGKTTMLNTICGLVRQKSGTIRFQGQELSRLAHKVVRGGIVQVPEGRKVFAGLTVRENLMAGGYIVDDHQKVSASIDKMFDLYPFYENGKISMPGPSAEASSRCWRSAGA